MLALLGLFIIPLIVGGTMFLFFRSTITRKEFLIMETVPIIIIAALFFLARWGALQDIEHLNGRITAKNHGTMHCCHCHQRCCGHDKNGTCNCWYEVCAHPHDYYWSLDISTGDEITIRNCEPNKNSVPAKWAEAYTGEPASVSHHFTNYLKADPDSLMHHGAHEQYLNQVPEFPGIYDFYKTNKVINIGGVDLPFTWEKNLREVNADLGESKQVDIILLATNMSDPAYAEAVESKWLYGPKNAIIIVAGIQDDKFSWVRVVTMSRCEDLKIELREQLKNWPVDKAEGGVAIIHKLVSEKFKRTPMAEYEYLMSAATPSTAIMIVLYIVAIIISVITGLVMHHNDVFHEEGLHNKRRER